MEGRGKSCGIPSSGHETVIGIMITQHMWLPALGLHKTRPGNRQSWTGERLRRSYLSLLNTCFFYGFSRIQSRSLPSVMYPLMSLVVCNGWFQTQAHTQHWISSEVIKQNKTKAMNVRKELVKRRESCQSCIEKREGKVRATKIHCLHACNCQCTKLIKFWKWSCS